VAFVGPAGLADLLVEGPDLSACAVEQVVRFAMGRDPDVDDRALVDDLTAAWAAGDGSFDDLLLALGRERAVPVPAGDRGGRCPVTRPPLDRRTLLRGGAGIALGLPLLEAMLNRHGTALAAGGALPKRFFVGFGGCALGCDGDPVHDLFVPDRVGAGYDLKLGTQSLANHGRVQDHVSLVSGLRIPYDTGSGIPAGGWWTEFHTEAFGPLISGVRGQHPQDYGVNGPTADQVVADDAIGGGTTFRSLQYQVQAAWYLTVSAPYGRDLLSWRRDGGGNLVSLPGQTSPKAAYDALFTSFVPPRTTPTPRPRRGSCCAVGRSWTSCAATTRPWSRSSARPTASASERHLDELRTLERQLDADAPELSAICRQYADPGPDPAVGGANEGSYGDTFDVNLGWSDEDTRARRFADLVHMAYACDLSRSVAMLYTMAQSHLNVHSYTGLGYDQHELGHSWLGTDVFSAVPAWHLDHFGYLVAKLRDTPEGAGSLLDSCAMVLLFEAGHGWDPATQTDNRTHSTENMAVCVAGGAGRARAGRTRGRDREAPRARPQHRDAGGRRGAGSRRGPGRDRRPAPLILPWAGRSRGDRSVDPAHPPRPLGRRAG
jgi:hypothetical protein